MSHIYFVYRTHYEGPLSKRVVRLPGTSVLEWFQGVWDEAKQAEDPYDLVCDASGGYVYGFSSIFRAIKKYQLPMPQTWQELNAWLKQYLYVEGPPNHIRQDAHTLRVKTNDDELDLAYFFFDQEIANAHPGRVAYLLQEAWNLPTDYCDGNYEPAIEIKPLHPSGQAEGKTYVCLLTFDDGDSIANATAQVIDGIRLPDLKNMALQEFAPSLFICHSEERGISLFPLEDRFLVPRNDIPILPPRQGICPAKSDTYPAKSGICPAKSEIFSPDEGRVWCFWRSPVHFGSKLLKSQKY